MKSFCWSVYLEQHLNIFILQGNKNRGLSGNAGRESHSPHCFFRARFFLQCLFWSLSGLCVQADLPGSGGPGRRSPPLRHPGAPSRFSSATRATPESLSPDQRDSAEVPVTPEKGGAPPPRSRRGSSAPCSRGPRASSVARTPAGRGSWAPVPVFCSCPARRTHTRCRWNGIAK